MPDEISVYLDKRLDDVAKFLNERDEVARCEVEIGRAVGRPEHGNIWRAEINLIFKGRTCRAEAVGESVNAAIDEVKDDIMRQLRQDRRLHIRLARRGGALLKRLLRFGKENED